MTLRELLFRITGGRPMHKIEQCVFVDRVSGKEVGRYRDRIGREWLAEGRWSEFRVAAQGDRHE